jgi:hypothetical protein
LGNGIDELFNMIGKQYLNPEISIYSNLTKEEKIKYEEHIKIEEIKNKNKNINYKKNNLKLINNLIKLN